MVAAFVRGGGDLFDVGANFGLVTFGTVPLLQGGGTAFHLFEANRRIIPVLQRSVREWPAERFLVHHCCVTDMPGVSNFALPDTSWGHGLISDRGNPVPNLIIDDYIEANGIQRISFLKLDVEGWEVHALRGARRALASGKVEAAFIEVAPEALRRTGSSAMELLGMLAAAGFDSYFAGMWDSPDPYGLSWSRVAINGDSLRFASAKPLPDSFIQGDVLVIHRSSPLASVVRMAVDQ